MKVGDMVKDNHPSRRDNERFGVIVAQDPLMRLNKSFKVLWHNGIIGNNVWDYDLKVVNESR